MNLRKFLFLIGIVLLVTGVVVTDHLVDRERAIQVSVADQVIASSETASRTLQDISQKTTYYAVEEGADKAQLTLTEREFPNGDVMYYIEAKTKGYEEPIKVAIPFSGKESVEYKKDTPVVDLYSYRKPRTIEDPLSTKLHYVANDRNSVVLGTSVYFKDISHTYTLEGKSEVREFQREAESGSFEKNQLAITVEFKPGEEQFSTWVMISEEQLIENEEEFEKAQRIGADEFRWMTPNTLWSHGLSSIFPASENAFVRSLVRQSGRASAVELETNPTRFWQNINRHHFASLESARSEDGLWHTNYTSTWLQSKYGIGPDYIDSRHNDNIFRSQLKRAEQLKYDSYAKERAVYADFLIEMTNEGFYIPEGKGYYLIDYYDLEGKTHASLNHVLSLMNYQYDAYLFLGDGKYLESAENQFMALESTGDNWINENHVVIYQMNLDKEMAGKDYNLVTYYDLLYTKKLRAKIGLPTSKTIDLLIKTKRENLREKNFPIDGKMANVEEFVGLIE